MPIQSRHIPKLAVMFKAMGNRTRLRILMELQKGPHNVTSIVKKLKMPQPTVSHHLALLRGAELVKAQRNGKEIIYSLNDADSCSERAVRATVGKPGGLKIGPLVFGSVKR